MTDENRAPTALHDGLDIESLAQAHTTLFKLSGHLRNRRDHWAATTPPDPEVYPDGRPNPYQSRITEVERVMTLVGQEIAHIRAERRGLLEKGELCTYCEQPEAEGHQLTGFDATGGSLRRFSPGCRTRHLETNGLPRDLES